MYLQEDKNDSRQKRIDSAVKRVSSNIEQDDSYLVADKYLLNAKSRLSRFAKCQVDDIFFVENSTLANKIIIDACIQKYKDKGNHIIVLSIDSLPIIEYCKFLENKGFDLTFLKVEKNGLADLQMLDYKIDEHTILVLIPHVCNQTGVAQNLEKIYQICNKKQVFLHIDCSYSFGKIPIKNKFLSSITIDSNQVFGPNNISAIVSNNDLIKKYILENNLCLPNNIQTASLANGFSKAVQLSFRTIKIDYIKVYNLREIITSRMQNSFEDIYFNGLSESSSPYIINFCIKGLEGKPEYILEEILNHDVIYSNKIICKKNVDTEYSHVLMAMGLNRFESGGAIRIILNRDSSNKEAETIFQLLGKGLKNAKKLFSLM